MRHWLTKLAGLPVLIYPVLVFWACRQTPEDPLASLLMLFLALLLPLWLLFRWLKSKSRKSTFVICLFLGGAVLSLGSLVWRDVLLHMSAYYRLSFLFQDLVAFAFLAYVFGSTLGKAREPMCSLFARHIHGTLSPLLLQYTRNLTFAWTIFFVVCGLVSLSFYVFASATLWAFVSNILMPILTLAFFVLETQFRRFVVPPEDYCGLLETFRSFKENSPIGKKIAVR